MTLLVTRSGGENARLQPMFMVFKNAIRSYPIRNLEDNAPGVTYRSRPKGWQVSDLFEEWLGKPRNFKPLESERKRILFVDNCHAHKMTLSVHKALEKSRSQIRFFSECATDLVQPADSFVNHAINAEWKKRWNSEVMKLIENKMWSNAWEGLGRLWSPAKAYFLNLAAAVVRDVSQRRDKDGVLLVRKAVICCGLGLDLNGLWEERQLSPVLQKIFKMYRDNFEGPL